MTDKENATNEASDGIRNMLNIKRKSPEIHVTFNQLIHFFTGSLEFFTANKTNGVSLSQ